MITLAIIAIVLSIAIFTMSGYIPKQRLISAQSQFSDLIQRAQTEANARSYWTCIKFIATSPLTAQIIVDKEPTGTPAGNHGQAGGCDQNNDLGLTTMTFKDNIQLASGSGCGENIKKDCIIWFDTTGSPKLCFDTDLTQCGSAAGAAGITSGNCIDWS